ncbi:hypothetical protein ASA86_17655 [Salmonella enterica subsp. enterica serovar Typhimurium var. 5-]|nr:hypothetical protein [Salmonella enterica subsp. enterica serovar Typhimurium var. 5-]
MFHTIVSIKNDGHYFCRAGGNRPDGLNEPVTCNPQVSTVWRHFCRDDGNQNMSLPGITGMVGRICRNNRCKKTDW